MMFKNPQSENEIIGLLSKLKDTTPEYPNDLMAARKAAYMSQIVSIKFDGPKQGGKGGGDGGSGTSAGTGGSGALGGMSAAQGILLQAVIGVWIIAGMLTVAYVFRDQIIGLLQKNGIVVEMTQAPLVDSPESVTSPNAVNPSPNAPPTEIVSPSVTSVPDVSAAGESDQGGSSEGQTSSENPDDNENKGLHLGQTPGAPDTPNQDNPNKPDKPDKSDKSNKDK